MSGKAPALTSWPDLAAFYAANPARATSPEADYGVHWAAPAEGRPAAWPRWRVSYIQATGEVYALCQQAHGPVMLLGVVPPDEDTRAAEGWDRGQAYYRTLDAILAGWAELDAAERELTWVTARLAAAGRRSDG